MQIQKIQYSFIVTSGSNTKYLVSVTGSDGEIFIHMHGVIIPLNQTGFSTDEKDSIELGILRLLKENGEFKSEPDKNPPKDTPEPLEKGVMYKTERSKNAVQEAAKELKDHPAMYNTQEVLMEYEKLKNKKKVEVLMDALGNMQQYNGRSISECIALAMDFIAKDNGWIKR